MILDEPTAALDIGHQQQALELLDELARRVGLTLVARDARPDARRRSTPTGWCCSTAAGSSRTAPRPRC